MPFTFKLSQRLARMRRAALLLSTAALAACELPVSTNDPGTTAVSRLVLSPKSLTLQPSQAADFVAVALTGSGDTVTASVSWSVTSGSITDTSTSGGRHYGRFKAGSDTGKVKVVAKGHPGQGSDTATVTITPAAVASVTVSPTSAALQPGQTQQFAATTRDSVGSVLAGRTVAWGSDDTGVMVVSSIGVVTAVAPGTATLSAISEGQIGTATVTVTAPPPPPPPPPPPQSAPGTVTDLAAANATDSSITLSFTEVSDGAGQPATYDVRFALSPLVWGSAAQVVRGTCATPLRGTGVGARRTCTVLGLAAATAYQFQLIAFRGTLNVDAVFGGLSNVASGTTAAGTPPPPSGVLVQEGFEDGAFAARGWYDNTAMSITTAQHVGGSRALEVHFVSGGTTPTWGGAARHLFTETESVYLSYWVKYSSNWVGSGHSYHPHEFLFLTNENGSYSGLSFTHLTAYVEHNYQNGGIPALQLQDGANVDQSRVGVDLSGVTENRAASGCNGNTDGYPTNCYNQGDGNYTNEKKFSAGQPWFMPTPGPGYKGDWHFVEAYFKLNTIQNGKGVANGIVRYWFDGQLVIEHTNVLMRSGAHASMKFNQLAIAPWIGDGSPVDQTMWVDNLTVATDRVASGGTAPR